MNFKTGFTAFIIGGLSGAIIALLYAPQSGEETRQILVDNSQKLKNEALDSIQQAQSVALKKVNEAQTRLEAINKETKDLLSQLQSIGESTFKSEKEVLEEGYEKAKETITT